MVSVQKLEFIDEPPPARGVRPRKSGFERFVEKLMENPEKWAKVAHDENRMLAPQLRQLYPEFEITQRVANGKDPKDKDALYDIYARYMGTTWYREQLAKKAQRGKKDTA